MISFLIVFESPNCKNNWKGPICNLIVFDILSPLMYTVCQTITRQTVYCFKPLICFFIFPTAMPLHTYMNLMMTKAIETTRLFISLGPPT